ncbi:hypothetical protein M942_08570 [Enterobacter ludwigii]|nr:hypothetical protein [Enterobacter ludwigii]AHE72780.1 hypothetical protein M942_08570 [Enterobacter ludwigii]
MSHKNGNKKAMASANAMAGTTINSEWLNKVMREISALFNATNP